MEPSQRGCSHQCVLLCPSLGTGNAGPPSKTPERGQVQLLPEIQTGFEPLDETGRSLHPMQGQGFSLCIPAASVQRETGRENTAKGHRCEFQVLQNPGQTLCQACVGFLGQAVKPKHKTSSPGRDRATRGLQCLGLFRSRPGKSVLDSS